MDRDSSYRRLHRFRLLSDRDAISFFERALARNVEVKDRRRDARLYRALEDGHRRLVDEVRTNTHACSFGAMDASLQCGREGGTFEFHKKMTDGALNLLPLQSLVRWKGVRLGPFFSD